MNRPSVLLDRDGTLIEDIPYNGDPARVELRPTAQAAIALLRSHNVPVAVVTNQSGIGRGLISAAQVEQVNAKVASRLGLTAAPFLVCPHTPDDRCECRKPRPALVTKAAARLGVPVEDCTLIGDIGADVEAALAAGAHAILVPTPVTRQEEIEAAPSVAPTLLAAVRRVVGADS